MNDLPNTLVNENNIDSRMNLEPQVIVLSGLPGSGKSVVGRILTSLIKSEVLQSDAIRKELFKHPTYSSEESNKVYMEMIRRSLDILSKGFVVILDATHSSKEKQDKILESFRSLGFSVRFVAINITDESIVEERLNNRVDDISDANYSTYLSLKEQFERATNAYQITNNSTLEELEVQVKRFIHTLVNQEH